jgi:AcrR family transcriptional regulator
MTSEGLTDTGLSTDTRQRLLDVTATLISRHGFAGTTLQMIADELGFTKAAIYYHFRAREQLLVALMDPILHQIRHAVETAERQPTERTRKEALLQGYASVVAKNRTLAAVMVFDPSVHQILQAQPDWGDLIRRQLALLMQSETDTTGIIKATAIFTGLAGAATGAPPDVDEQSLIEHLCDIGRRVLGLRQPRRQGRAQLDAAAPPTVPAPAGRWRDFLTEATPRAT